MPNTLFSATANPAIIPSGGATTITVLYEATVPAQMTIGSTGPYTISSTQRTLSPGNTTDTFQETITGPPGVCVLSFVFLGSGVTTMVVVQ